MKNKKNLGKTVALAMLLGIAGTSNAQWVAGTSPNYYAPLGDNIGIGTSTPISPLQLTGILTVGSGSSANAIGTVQITTSGASPAANRLIFGTDGTGWQFRFSKNQSGTITDLVTLQDNGNVGIGTGNPFAPLTVSRTNPTNGVMEQFSNGTYTMLFADNITGATDYNNLTALGDNGIFWSDGLGAANANSGFVIAPWVGSYAGIRIAANGNVGIGTTNPICPLDIGTSTANGYLHVAGNTSPTVSSQGAYLSWNGYNGGTGETDFINNQGQSGSTGGGFAFYNVPQSGAVISNTAPSVFITGAGNVGIGTASPTTVLNVAVPYQSSTHAFSIVNPIFCTNTKPPTCRQLTVIFDVDANGNTAIAGNTSIAGNTYVTGNLVIGSGFAIPGSYGLYVGNGILTSQVKIALPTDAANWSDYVFANNYKLKPITEVAQYIQDNKHLPEVPSATDVQKAGIDVAGMDATLLKKIEELTLYMIDQHKEIEDLKTQLETIKKAQK